MRSRPRDGQNCWNRPTIFDKDYHFVYLRRNAADPGASRQIDLTVAQLFPVFIAACLLTSIGLVIFLRIHSRLGLLDIPNERSSHSAPVPRGGGLVVVTISITSYLAACFWFGLIPDIVFVLTGLCIAVVGFIDDMRSISPLPRLGVQIVAAVFLVWNSGGFPGLMVPLIGSIHFGPIGPVLSVLFIVWMINS